MTPDIATTSRSHGRVPFRVYQLPAHEGYPPQSALTGLSVPLAPGDDPRYVQEHLAIEFRTRPAPPRRPGSSTLLPSPETFGARAAVTLLEVIRGTCPAATIKRLVAPRVLASIERRRMNDHGTRHRPAQVRRVVGSRTADGIYEAAVILDTGARVHAMALRLVATHGRWCVTDMSLT